MIIDMPVSFGTVNVPVDVGPVRRAAVPGACSRRILQLTAACVQSEPVEPAGPAARHYGSERIGRAALHQTDVTPVQQAGWAALAVWPVLAVWTDVRRALALARWWYLSRDKDGHQPLEWTWRSASRYP